MVAREIMLVCMEREGAYMDWSTLITGIVLIVGVCALALWANHARYKQATRFREQREARQAEQAGKDVDVP